MKSLVVYSSLTGNTKMVAEAIAKALGEDTVLAAVDAAPSAEQYDFVAVGYWVDRGTADKKAAAYLKLLKNKKVALFATLGAYPDSEHARQSLANGAALLDSSNTVVGTFICQGKVDPKLVEQMAKQFPADHPHGMNEARKKRLADAAQHPNEEDLQKAQETFRKIKAQLAE